MMKNLLSQAAPAAPGGGLPQNVSVGNLPGGSNLVGAITVIVNGFLILVGIVAVIYIILGGIKYISAQGESQEVEKAKNTVIYAVIGLIVVGLAAVIVNFVLSTLS